MLDAHERLELASRLVEGELLGEREHEPAAFPQADAHHVLAKHEALGASALWLQPVDPPSEVVGPVERLLAYGPHRRLAAGSRDPLDAIAVAQRDSRAVHYPRTACPALSRSSRAGWLVPRMILKRNRSDLWIGAKHLQPLRSRHDRGRRDLVLETTGIVRHELKAIRGIARLTTRSPRMAQHRMDTGAAESTSRCFSRRSMACDQRLKTLGLTENGRHPRELGTLAFRKETAVADPHCWLRPRRRCLSHLRCLGDARTRREIHQRPAWPNPATDGRRSSTGPGQ